MADYTELIKALRCPSDPQNCKECAYNAYGEVCFSAAMFEAADVLEMLIGKAELLPKWIDVDERLPETFKPVIVARECAKGETLKVEQGYKDVGEWWKVYGTRTKQVRYWQPLPEPPEEVQALWGLIKKRDATCQRNW